MGHTSDIRAQRIGSISRKHLLAVREYWTWKKLLNLAVSTIEEKSLTERVRAMPYTATIDVTNVCNLRCPGCPTGLGLPGRAKSMMSLEILQAFLDQTAEHLLVAHLYNWGEPLLHPRIADIVRLVHERKIFTSLSSHLSIDHPELLVQVCDAGLDHLIVSLDGASEGTYQRYRRGGDFELVLENIRRIAAHKRSMRRQRPIIEWQMLGFRHLEAEIPRAAERARALGADWFTVRGAMAPESWQPTDDALKGAFYGGQGRCGLLWHNVTLQSDGGIAPCCFLYHQEDDFGHASDGAIRAIRNNHPFRTARLLFDPGAKVGRIDDMNHPCLRCPIVHKQEHLREVLASRPEAVATDEFMSIVADRDELTAIRSKF